MSMKNTGHIGAAARPITDIQPMARVLPSTAAAARSRSGNTPTATIRGPGAIAIPSTRIRGAAIATRGIPVRRGGRVRARKEGDSDARRIPPAAADGRAIPPEDRGLRLHAAVAGGVLGDGEGDSY